jgi:hypothetical protein
MEGGGLMPSGSTPSESAAAAASRLAVEVLGFVGYVVGSLFRLLQLLFPAGFQQTLILPG